MKKVFLFFVAVLFVSAVITSCNKDNDDGSSANIITETMADVGYKVDSVYLVNSMNGNDLASAEFKNNQFTIKLPTPSSLNL